MVFLFWYDGMGGLGFGCVCVCVRERAGGGGGRCLHNKASPLSRFVFRPNLFRGHTFVLPASVPHRNNVVRYPTVRLFGVRVSLVKCEVAVEDHLLATLFFARLGH